MKVTSAKQCVENGCQSCPGYEVVGSSGKFNSNCYCYEDLEQFEHKTGSRQHQDQISRMVGVYPSAKPPINFEVFKPHYLFRFF